MNGRKVNVYFWSHDRDYLRQAFKKEMALRSGVNVIKNINLEPLNI